MNQLKGQQFKKRVLGKLDDVSFLPIHRARATQEGQGKISDPEIFDPNELFVREAYNRILGRKADPLGLQHHLHALRSGVPRTLVLDSLHRSPEAATRRQENYDRPGFLQVKTATLRYLLLQTVIRPLRHFILGEASPERQ